MRRYAIHVTMVFFMFAAAATLAAGAQDFWAGRARLIDKEVTAAVRLYERGQAENAMSRMADAYFTLFEADEANMEIAVRKRISLQRAVRLEKGFVDVRRAMQARASLVEVNALLLNLKDTLRGSAEELDRKGVAPEALK